jgi:hypothetical protein
VTDAVIKAELFNVFRPFFLSKTEVLETICKCLFNKAQFLRHRVPFKFRGVLSEASRFTLLLRLRC